MNDRLRGVKLGEITTRVSLAVELTDSFTDRPPLGTPRVRIENRNMTPIRTPSHFHVFTDLPADTVTVRIDSEDRYLPERIEDVTVKDLIDPATDIDPSDPATLPLVQVDLIPAPPYRFPAGTTRIRGSVSDSAGDPVPEADLTVPTLEASTRTTDTGEFVLFLTGLTDEDVRAADNDRLVTVDGGDPTIEVEHPDLGATSESVTVPEGTLTVRHIAYP